MQTTPRARGCYRRLVGDLHSGAAIRHSRISRPSGEVVLVGRASPSLKDVTKISLPLRQRDSPPNPLSPDTTLSDNSASANHNVYATLARMATTRHTLTAVELSPTTHSHQPAATPHTSRRAPMTGSVKHCLSAVVPCDITGRRCPGVTQREIARHAFITSRHCKLSHVCSSVRVVRHMRTRR